MRKELNIFLMLFLFVSFVVALDQPSTGVDVGSGDVEKIQGGIDQIPIDPDTGKFVNPLNQTVAEKRIEAINTWLVTNASWLKVVLGMVPEISLLFAINMWVWLIAVVYIILKSYLFVPFSKMTVRIGGGVVFVGLLFLKVYYKIALILYNLVDLIWNFLLPWGMITAISIAVILGILWLGLLFFAPKMLDALALWMKSQKEMKVKEEEELNRKALDIIVKKTIKGN